MAVRQVRCQPVALDGVGSAAFARGYYRMTPDRRLNLTEGELQLIPLVVPVDGIEVIIDLPIIELADPGAIKVEGFFLPGKTTPSSVDYVKVPSGSGSITLQALPKVDPSSLGPITAVPTAVELRLQVLEAGGVGTGGSSTVDTLGGMTDVGKAVAKAGTGSTGQAAARTAIGAGTSSLALGTAAGTAADAAALATSLGAKASLTGAAFSGPVTVQTATAAGQPVTKAQLDAVSAAVSVTAALDTDTDIVVLTVTVP